MIYLDANNTTHTIQFIARKHANFVNLKIWHELTNDEFRVALKPCTLVNNYSSVNFDFNFLPNANYTIEILDDLNFNILMFRGKIRTYE